MPWKGASHSWKSVSGGGVECGQSGGGLGWGGVCVRGVQQRWLPYCSTYKSNVVKYELFFVRTEVRSGDAKNLLKILRKRDGRCQHKSTWHTNYTFQINNSLSEQYCFLATANEMEKKKNNDNYRFFVCHCSGRSRCPATSLLASVVVSPSKAQEFFGITYSLNNSF